MDKHQQAIEHCERLDEKLDLYGAIYPKAEVVLTEKGHYLLRVPYKGPMDEGSRQDRGSVRCYYVDLDERALS